MRDCYESKLAQIARRAARRAKESVRHIATDTAREVAAPRIPCALAERFRHIDSRRNPRIAKGV